MASNKASGLSINALCEHLLEMHLVRTKSNTSFFILKHLVVTIYVFVYVDDIIITGNHPQVIKFVISSLANFLWRILAFYTISWGVNVNQVSNSLILCHSKYIMDILFKLDMDNCKAISTPMCSSMPLWVPDDPPPTHATHYQRTLCKLQYLSLTWPGISYVVNKLSHFMHDSIDEH